jgi:transcriptional regulator with XRE-family HTH domain
MSGQAGQRPRDYLTVQEGRQNMPRKTKMPAVKSTKGSRFSEWLKAELEARDMTQADLCRALGKNPSIINKLLKCGGTPRPKTVNSIADFMFLPREELYRVAGFLPPLSREAPHWERIKYKYSLLNSKNQDKFEHLLDFELMEQRRGEDSKK